VRAGRQMLREIFRPSNPRISPMFPHLLNATRLRRPVRLMGSTLSCWQRCLLLLLGAAVLNGCASFAVHSDGEADIPDLGSPVEDAVRLDGPDSDGSGAMRAESPPAIQDAVPAASPDDRVPSFSAARPGARRLTGWEPWVIHPAKKRTRYRLVSEGDRTVLRARASSSASGLMARLDADPERTPVMRWSWKALASLPDADTADATREDSPLRVVVAFDGDKQSLPVADRMFFERVRLFTGRDMPYATLMYVWEHGKPLETVVRNPHTGRVRKIVVSSGPDNVKRWQRFQRNLVDDYQRVFGHRPGRIVGIAVMTDSDNTRQDVDAIYGDISLSAN